MYRKQYGEYACWSIPLHVDTVVSSHRLLYAHRYFCILIILHFHSAATISPRFINWTPGKGYFIIKRKFMWRIAFCWPKKLNRFFVCYFCAISVNQYVQWKPKEYNTKYNYIFVCHENLRARKIVHKTVFKWIWNT